MYHYFISSVSDIAKLKRLQKKNSSSSIQSFLEKVEFRHYLSMDLKYSKDPAYSKDPVIFMEKEARQYNLIINVYASGT